MMMVKQRRSQANPLVRRLQRHANMAVAFRSPAESGGATAETGSPNLVRAFVWPTAAAPDAADATIDVAERPITPPGPRQPAAELSQPHTRQSAAVKTAVSGQMPQTASRVEPTAAPPVQRQPDDAYNQPSPLARLWQRVGEIIRPSSPRSPSPPAPAETEPAGQTAPVAPATAPSAVQRRPEAMAAPPPDAAVAHRPPAAAAPAPRPADDKSTVPTPEDKAAPLSTEDRNWRRLETIMQRHKKRLAAEEAAQPDEPGPDTDSDAGKPVVQRQPAPQPKPSGAPSPAKQAPTPSGSDAGRQRPGTDTTPATFTARAGRRPQTQPVDVSPPVVDPDEPTPPTAAADTLSPAGSGVPLQAAWPVQRTEAAPTIVPQSDPLPPPPPGPIPEPPPVEAGRIKERLASVPPGMPTDSSVPLMRSRQPRPQRSSAPPPAAPPQPAEEQPPAAGSGQQQAPLPIVQRPEETGHLVPTEIGDLPADLWQLIGQQPPDSEATAVAPPAPAAETGHPIQREIEETESTAVAPSPPPSEIHTFIQREPEAKATAADRGMDTVEFDARSEEEDKAETAIDVDELARQVYAQLKQQLAGEKERERGRFAPDW
jgi:hypothetical protein